MAVEAGVAPWDLLVAVAEEVLKVDEVLGVMDKEGVLGLHPGQVCGRGGGDTAVEEGLTGVHFQWILPRPPPLKRGGVVFPSALHYSLLGEKYGEGVFPNAAFIGLVILPVVLVLPCFDDLSIGPCRFGWRG